MNKILKLQEIILQSKNLVFFGGAGVSTASGIPDFRSQDGLYNQTYDYPPEKIISHRFFKTHPDEFFRFYKDRMIYKNAKANSAHLKLAELERKGILKTVITQNIDGLHQAAGSQNVLELHGSIHRNFCQSCKTFYDLNFILQSKGIPLCKVCNNPIKPDVVLYEEALDSSVAGAAIEAIKNADTLIIAGTSLIVYPAASFVHYFKGNHFILIDKRPNWQGEGLIIQDDINHVFENIHIS